VYKFHLLAWLVLGICLAPVSVLAQEPDEETQAAEATEAPRLEKPPVLLEQLPVSLPKDTIFPAQQVPVVLDLLVNEKGGVTEATVVEGAGEPFDAAAVASALMFQFKPALLNTGAATPVRIRFRLVIDKPLPPPPPPVKFVGRILERGTRKPLKQVPIAIKVDDKVVLELSTDDKGFFRADVPNAVFVIVGISPQHERLEVLIEAVAGEEREELYYLQELGGRFEEVIRGRRLKREVTRRVIPREEVMMVAGTQGDAIKVVENLPGSNRSPSAGPGAGQVILRGSNPGDSLVLLEGHEIPLIYHFGAIRSSFNSGFLESVEFVPGNFSADFGRATGGVVQVKVRDLDSEAFRGNVDVNLYDAGFLLEGPLGDGWTGGFAFHRSYIDAILPAVIPDDSPVSFNTAPRYYDYQMIAAKDFGDAGKFRGMFYGSLDTVKILFDDPNSDPISRGALNAVTMFHNLQFQYESDPADWIHQETSLQSGLTKLNFELGPELYFNLRTCPLDLRSIWDFELNDTLTLRSGLDSRLVNGEIQLNLPRAPQEGDEPAPISSRELYSASETFMPFTPGVFVEAQYEPLEGLLLSPSLRVDYYSELGHVSLDPRFFARWVLSETTLISGGVGLYQRPPDPYESDPGFGNPDLLPERSLHTTLGFEQALPLDTTLEMTGFYKAIDRIVVNNPASYTDDTEPTYINEGKGRIFGLEMLLRFAPIPSVRGWVSYTFQRSFRTDAPGEEERLFDFDQPNILTLVASWKIGWGWSLGARFRYVSGNPWTPIDYTIYDSNSDVYVPVYGPTNSDRLSPFMQLDVRVDKQWVYDTWKLTLYIDVQNATNRGNQEGWSYNFDFSEEAPLTGLPIAPILGLKGEW
jgi:TonB family protein